MKDFRDVRKIWHKKGRTLFLFPASEHYYDLDRTTLFMAEHRKGKKFIHWRCHWAKDERALKLSYSVDLTVSSNKCSIISDNYKMSFLLLAAKNILCYLKCYIKLLYCCFENYFFLIIRGTPCSLKQVTTHSLKRKTDNRKESRTQSNYSSLYSPPIFYSLSEATTTNTFWFKYYWNICTYIHLDNTTCEYFFVSPFLCVYISMYILMWDLILWAQRIYLVIHL